jgi:hypothetical protein
MSAGTLRERTAHIAHIYNESTARHLRPRDEGLLSLVFNTVEREPQKATSLSFDPRKTSALQKRDSLAGTPPFPGLPSPLIVPSTPGKIFPRMGLSCCSGP